MPLSFLDSAYQAIYLLCLSPLSPPGRAIQYRGIRPALFAAFTSDLPQNRCHELQREPSQDRGHDRPKYHDRRERVDEPRRRF